MGRPICKGCTKVIQGKISIDTYRRTLGKRVISEVHYYCKSCFRKLNIERSWNVYRKEKEAGKRKNNS